MAADVAAACGIGAKRTMGERTMGEGGADAGETKTQAEQQAPSAGQ